MPVFLSDIPDAVPLAADPARRRARPALAAEPSRPLHARAPRSTPRWPRSSRRAPCSPRSTSRCRARSGTRSCRSRASTAFAHTDRPLVEHAPSPPTRGRGAHRRARRRPRRGRLVPADGHRRDPRRGARAARQQARSRRPHRDVLRRAHPARRGRRRHEHEEEGARRAASSRASSAARARSSTSSTTTSWSSCTRATARTTPRSSRKNDRVVAINSAIEIDLTGQVCADSIGHRIYSGIGGQMDFIRGAARSAGGKPIIALPSTAAGGQGLAHRRSS